MTIPTEASTDIESVVDVLGRIYQEHQVNLPAPEQLTQTLSRAYVADRLTWVVESEEAARSRELFLQARFEHLAVLGSRTRGEDMIGKEFPWYSLLHALDQ